MWVAGHRRGLLDRRGGRWRLCIGPQGQRDGEDERRHEQRRRAAHHPGCVAERRAKGDGNLHCVSPVCLVNSSWPHYTTNALYSGGRLGYNKGAQNDPKTDPTRGASDGSVCMEPISSFGYWLRRRRRALDLTQDELARKIGCALGTLKKIETDERRPSKQLAERLADCLEIPATERATFLKAARTELAVDRLDVAAVPERPEAARSPMPLPAGTVTFLFTDIEGSTQLWQRHPQA